jgi:tetratricopeptide (TPR) repeat protein
MMRAIFLLMTLSFAAGAFGCRDAERAQLEYQRAEKLYSERALSEALAAYKSALDADASLHAAQIGVARTLYYQREYAAAEAPLLDLLRKEPCHVHARIWLARVQSLQKDRADQALATADAGLACGPSAELWRLKGMLHESRGELTAALAAYRSAIAVTRESAQAAVQLAALYQQLGQGDRYAQARALALRLAGDDPTVILELQQLERSALRESAP